MIDENIAVGLLSERLALACGYRLEKARQLRRAAELHDIGKALLPDSLLQKPDKLTDAEFVTMKLHTLYGAWLLSAVPCPFKQLAMEVAWLHHEWYNGKGYWGYKSAQLPLHIRIVSVVDVYIALVSERIYKTAWSMDEALDYVANRAGTQFCPKITNAFILLVNRSNWSAEVLERCLDPKNSEHKRENKIWPLQMYVNSVQ